MDKLTRYGEIIKKILTEYYQIVEKAPDFHPENCLIFDDNNHHYFWRSIDWVNKKRVNNTHIYVRIKFAVLPYEEFLKIQELLEDLEDLRDLRDAKEEERNSVSMSLEDVKSMLLM
jgi:hypothetical protein